MTTAIQKPDKSSKSREASAKDSPALRELDLLITELKDGMTTAVDRALRIGLHLISIYRQSGGQDGGFKAAMERIEGHKIARSTAYRWINATGRFLARHQGIADEHGGFEQDDLKIPAPGTKEFSAVEKAIGTYAATTSLRRLMLGSTATGEESRMDSLIDASEQGDTIADEILEKIAAGELTLVQAIRAKAGASATKGKERHDPVYLDLDGESGECKGLFPKALITLNNTFSRWNDLDETARHKAKAAWKALVANLPKELK